MEEASELVARLRPIRLPEDFATFGPSDALAAFSLGVVLALAALALMRPLLARRTDPLARARAEIARLSRLPTGERAYRLALLLDRFDPARRTPRPANLGATLYRPEADADLADLETAVLATAKSARRVRP